jgi:hypothetical protein
MAGSPLTYLLFCFAKASGDLVKDGRFAIMKSFPL